MNHRALNPAQAEKIHTRLVSLFYQLLRDHVLPADIEKVFQTDHKHIWDKGSYDKENEILLDDKVVFSNPFLAEYAEDLASRVFGARPEVSISGPKVRKI
jgi:hypothetical protein